jgi:hypothetical protein
MVNILANIGKKRKTQKSSSFIFYFILKRAFIWRCLLRLPENHAAYAALVEKGGHSTFAKLQEQYPLKSRKLLRIMQRYEK